MQSGCGGPIRLHSCFVNGPHQFVREFHEVMISHELAAVAELKSLDLFLEIPAPCDES